MPDTLSDAIKICMHPAFFYKPVSESFFIHKITPHAMPDAILRIRTAYHLTWFFISPPPVWAGICRTARQGCLIPYSSLSCCNIPRTPLRLPCSPAEVSLSPGFQGRMPLLPHAGDAAPIFPSPVTVPWFNPTKVLPLPFLWVNISSRSSPPITP